MEVGLLLLTHHTQTSVRTDGEICWQARTSADSCKKKKVAVFGRRNRWVKKERKINKVVDQQNQ